MRKKITIEQEIEIRTCNICGEEVSRDPFYSKRIEAIRGLFNTKEFDAHEKCLNSVMKLAFKKYFPDRPEITHNHE